MAINQTQIGGENLFFVPYAPRYAQALLFAFCRDLDIVPKWRGVVGVKIVAFKKTEAIAIRNPDKFAQQYNALHCGELGVQLRIFALPCMFREKKGHIAPPVINTLVQHCQPARLVLRLQAGFLSQIPSICIAISLSSSRLIVFSGVLGRYLVNMILSGRFNSPISSMIYSRISRRVLLR